MGENMRKEDVLGLFGTIGLELTHIAGQLEERDILQNFGFQIGDIVNIPIGGEVKQKKGIVVGAIRFRYNAQPEHLYIRGITQKGTATHARYFFPAQAVLKENGGG